MRRLTPTLLAAALLATAAWFALSPPPPPTEGPAPNGGLAALEGASAPGSYASRPGVWGRLRTRDGREASGQEVALLYLREPAVLPQQALRRDGSFADRVLARADALGVFHLEPRNRGGHLALLAVEAPDHAPFYLPLGRLEPRSVHDLEELHLAAGARLAGTVRRADGDPLDGPARLTLLPSLEVGSLPPLPLPAASDVAPLATETVGDGRWVLPHVPPGRYALLVEPPAPLAPRISSYFSLREGEHAIQDLEVAVGRTVRGLVRDGDAAPVANARVRLLAEPPDPFCPALELRTGADGAFSTQSLAARGSVRVEVTRAGFRAYERVFEDDARQWRILLAPELALTGRVVDARTDAPLGDCWVGSFAPDALTEERLASEGLLSRQSLPHRTAPDGTFRIEGHAPGTYVVLAAHAEYLPARSELVAVVESGSEPVELRLERGATLALDVFDPAGNPASGVVLELRHAPRATDEPEIVGRYRHPPLGRLVRAATTAGGHAEFARLPPGSYRVFVRARGHEHELPFPLAIEPGVDRVERRLDLGFPARLEGTLTLGEEPTDAWKLFALHVRGEAFEAVPGDEGRYAFPPLPAGTFRIVPVPRSRHLAEARWAPLREEVIEHPLAREIELEPGERRALTFRLEPEPLARIRGVVQIGAGPYRVVFRAPGSPPGTPLVAFPSALTADDGAFEIPSLPVGTYDVLVVSALERNPREHVLVERTWIATEGLNDLGVLVATTTSVQGRVVDETGGGVGPGEIVVTRGGRGSPRRVPVDTSGGFSLGELPEGVALQCVIAIRDHEPNPQTIVVRRGEEARLTTRRR